MSDRPAAKHSSAPATAMPRLHVTSSSTPGPRQARARGWRAAAGGVVPLDAPHLPARTGGAGRERAAAQQPGDDHGEQRGDVRRRREARARTTRPGEDQHAATEALQPADPLRRRPGGPARCPARGRSGPVSCRPGSCRRGRAPGSSGAGSDHGSSGARSDHGSSGTGPPSPTTSVVSWAGASEATAIGMVKGPARGRPRRAAGGRATRAARAGTGAVPGRGRGPPRSPVAAPGRARTGRARRGGPGPSPPPRGRGRRGRGRCRRRRRWPPTSARRRRRWRRRRTGSPARGSPGVPSSHPVWVSLGSSATRARPKSMRMGVRPSISTLEGLMSRCRTPTACTAASASARQLAAQTRSGPVIGPSWCTWSCSESPGT